MNQSTRDALREGYQVCLESAETNDDELLQKIMSTVWSKIDCPEKHYLDNLKEHFDNSYTKYAADRNGTNADAVASDIRELASICSQMSTCCRAMLGKPPFITVPFALTEASDERSINMRNSALEKIGKFAQLLTEKYEPGDRRIKVGEYIVDEMKHQIDEGKYNGRLSLPFFTASKFDFFETDLKPFAGLLNDAGIRTELSKAPKAFVIDVNFQDKSDEREMDDALISKIEAALSETGVDVPGINDILAKLRRGAEHWIDGGSGFGMSGEEFHSHKNAFFKFVEVAPKYGLAASVSPWKFGEYVTLSW